MMFAVAYKLERSSSVQLLIGASQFQCMCNFFDLGTPKSNQKALSALLLIDSSSFSVDLRQTTQSGFIFMKFLIFGSSDNSITQTTAAKLLLGTMPSFYSEGINFYYFFDTHEHQIFSY